MFSVKGCRLNVLSFARANNYTCPHVCDTAAEFCRALARLGAQDADSGEATSRPTAPRAMYIILDRAERLRQLEGVFDTLLRLPELTGCRCGVVLLSSVFWDSLQGFLAVPDPIQVTARFHNLIMLNYSNIR